MLHIRPRVRINCKKQKNLNIDPILAEILFDFFLPYNNSQNDIDLIDFLNLFFQAYQKYLVTTELVLAKLTENMTIENFLKTKVAPINREAFVFLFQDQLNADLTFNFLKTTIQRKITDNNRQFAKWQKANERRLSNISKGRTPKSCPKRKRSSELTAGFYPCLSSQWLTQKYLFELLNELIRD